MMRGYDVSKSAKCRKEFQAHSISSTSVSEPSGSKYRKVRAFIFVMYFISSPLSCNHFSDNNGVEGIHTIIQSKREFEKFLLSTS